MRCRVVKITGIVLLGLLAVLIGTAFAVLNQNTIYPGVKIAGIEIDGLSKNQAAARLSSQEVRLLKKKITLKIAEDSRELNIEDIGGELDAEACAQSAWEVGRYGSILDRISQIVSSRRNGVDLPAIYGIRKTKTVEYLKKISKEIDCSPVDARPVVEKDVFKIEPEKQGIKLDIEASAEKIAEAVSDGSMLVEAVVERSDPKITTENLAGIDGVLAVYSTRYKPWERDRTHNLKIACKAINGTIVPPGDTFSYNKTVGPRVKKLGFREAPIFLNGEVETGTGGGVCQVSTTLYNAALLADLKIVQRAHHSRPVAYAPIGRDATVVWRSADLKFTNTSEAPIYIAASVGKKTVDIAIYGRIIPGRQVRVYSAGHKIITAPIVTKIGEDVEAKEKVLKQGRSGHRISVYRLVKLNGKVVKRERISKDYYKPESRIVVVPPPVQTPTQDTESQTDNLQQNTDAQHTQPEG